MRSQKICQKEEQGQIDLDPDLIIAKELGELPLEWIYSRFLRKLKDRSSLQSGSAPGSSLAQR